MHFEKTDTVCNQPVELVRSAIRRVEIAQWCSAGVVSRDLEMSPDDSRALMLSLQRAGYLHVYQTPPLPAGHDGEWLPGEDDDPLFLLWHITNLGLTLAHAKIGDPLDRAQAEQLLSEALVRAKSVAVDPSRTHDIEQVLLCGSLLDADKESFGDVDLIVEARQRGTVDGSATWNLEQLVAGGEERLQVMVFDQTSDCYPIPQAAARRVIYPDGEGPDAHATTSPEGP